MITSSLSSMAFPSIPEGVAAVCERYPFRAGGYVCGLIRHRGDPIWKQIIPDVRELDDRDGLEDPLAEEDLSPVPNLVHRYPNRVLWLVSRECVAHCRFCTRKRRWKRPVPMTGEMLDAGLEYIRNHGQIQDVLLSGGDPLLLSPGRLEHILASLRGIPHVGIIRIGTRVPVFSPQTVTPELVRTLSRRHPLFMNLHFNHPWELTPEVAEACRMLVEGGIPLGSQTVLLRGVNDEAGVLGELFQGLLRFRVRPYYLMQMDLTRGTAHFRTPLARGIEILSQLRNRISGLAMPQLVVDLPGGHGKVPLTPNWVEGRKEDRLIFRDYQGRQVFYPLLPGEGEELGRWLGTRV
ncbi:MAG: KamA family radical SAM protein [Syntrophobacteraceae bacterium]|nr:KamA family radical SAM protein [Syntrophobacteraceae bacterium]